MLGPFSALPFTPWFQISLMMTRPKKHSTAKRVIMDLSFPPGCSVNACITRGYYQGTQFNFSLSSVSMLADRLSSLGQDAWLWSADLAHVYRQLHTCPLSIPLLGLKINDQYFVIISLPFRCRTSALMCARTLHAHSSLVVEEGRLL